MKKIRNIRDLENERLKLRVKQLELEKQLDRSWKGLRSDLSMNKVEEQKQPMAAFTFKTGNGLLNGALNYGAIFLSHRVGLIAGKTIENAAERILGKLSQKINSLASKKKRFQKG
jgi:hypothetical protein